MQIICPLCRQPLTATEKSWHCDNRHNFDIAKQGYCNLLPVQNKKSKSPGDDAQMVAARKAFLGEGHYLPLAQQLNLRIIEQLQSKQLTNTQLVDAGCGEGYYTSLLGKALRQHADDHQLIGTDISKHAIVAAAKQDKHTQWFVANSNALPVATHSNDVLLSLFAPTQAAEFHRCLKKDGLLILATTGKNHLLELRELLYQQVNDAVFDPNAVLEHYFTAVGVETIDFELHLQTNQAIKNLLAMTPHYWRATPERKATLDELTALSVTVNIQLHRYKPH
jgi:23S rRNA (guanine745-N1)-methyltransferase